MQLKGRGCKKTSSQPVILKTILGLWRQVLPRYTEERQADALERTTGGGCYAHCRRHRIEAAWFAFRAEALRQIALGWCEENDIVWE